MSLRALPDACCPVCGRALEREFASLGVTLVDRKLFYRRMVVVLAVREMQIFRAMLNIYPALLANERIFHSIWSSQTDPKILQVYIHHLRKKLTPLGIKIETVYGVGYRLVLPA